MRNSIKVGNALGIPIKLHVSFLLILPFIIWAFAQNPAPFGFKNLSFEYFGYVEYFRILFSAATTILLFSCIILHELSHSYIALQNGISIRSITLFIFGGLASIEKMPRDPKVESKMAIAGPAISMVLSVLFFTLYMLSARFIDGKSGIILLNEMVTSLSSGGDGIAVFELTTMFFVLGNINFVLAIFNLLPAFPMDGGRFLRAYLAKRMPYLKATKWAVNFGKIIAVLMGLFGIFAALFGLSTNPVLILIAFFVFIVASEEEKATIIDMSLEGLKVKDLMAVEQQNQSFNDYSSDDLLPDTLPSDATSISSEDDAIEALKIIMQGNIGRLIVTEDGKVVGILSRADLIKAVNAIKVKREMKWEI